MNFDCELKKKLFVVVVDKCTCPLNLVVTVLIDLY